MKKITTKKECVPMSFKCVSWEGGDISCLNICNDDTAEDVVVKIAEQTCENTTLLDLSDLDISFLLGNCSDCTDPDKKLITILRLIIQKMEAMGTDINTLKESL